MVTLPLLYIPNGYQVYPDVNHGISVLFMSSLLRDQARPEKTFLLYTNREVQDIRFNFTTSPSRGMEILILRFFASAANTFGGSCKGSSERSNVP